MTKNKLRVAKTYIWVRNALLITLGASIILGFLGLIIWGAIADPGIRLFVLVVLSGIVAAGIVRFIARFDAWAEKVVETHK